MSKASNLFNTSLKDENVVWFPKKAIDVYNEWEQDRIQEMQKGSKDYTEEELANNPIFQQLIKDFPLK